MDSSELIKGTSCHVSVLADGSLTDPSSSITDPSSKEAIIRGQMGGIRVVQSTIVESTSLQAKYKIHIEFTTEMVKLQFSKNKVF